MNCAIINGTQYFLPKCDFPLIARGRTLKVCLTWHQSRSHLVYVSVLVPEDCLSMVSLCFLLNVYFSVAVPVAVHLNCVYCCDIDIPETFAK